MQIPNTVDIYRVTDSSGRVHWTMVPSGSEYTPLEGSEAKQETYGTPMNSIQDVLGQLGRAQRKRELQEVTACT